MKAAASRRPSPPPSASSEHLTKHRRPFYVANRLWRLPVDQALATVVLPLHLNWSRTGQQFDLRNRRQRLHCYEILLREGDGREIMTYIDGALLSDLWSEMYLPQEIKIAWTALIEHSQQ